MELKPLIGSAMAVALLGFGALAGSVTGPSPAAAAQTAAATPTASAAAPAQTKPAITAAITQAQAEAAALAASPGNTVDHTQLGQASGKATYDVDFANGGGVIIDATSGAVITKEAAGADQGGGRGHGGGGADQAALLAQAKVTQAQAEAAAVAASPGNTVNHSRLSQKSGTLVWDVDFANGGGAQVDATSGAIITNEAAGSDHAAPQNSTPSAQPTP